MRQEGTAESSASVATSEAFGVLLEPAAVMLAEAEFALRRFDYRGQRRKPPPSAIELEGARYQGHHVAAIATKLS